MFKVTANFTMDSVLHFIAFGFVLYIFPFQASALDDDVLSSLVVTRSRYHFKVSPFESFHSVGVVTCALRCQRHVRCVSMRFRKTFVADDLRGVCELYDQEAMLSDGQREEVIHEDKTAKTQIHFLVVSSEAC